MDLFDKCSKHEGLKKAKESGLYPYFHMLTTGQDTKVVMEGIDVVMIGSNNYLGLTSDERVKKAGLEAIKKYGSGCSGSRYLNGTLDLHVALNF